MNEQKKSVAEEASHDVVDTRGMSEGKRAALELTESARESVWQYPTFAGKLFMGALPWDMVFPFPALDREQVEAGEAFLGKLRTFLRDHADPDEIDRTGEIPDEVVKGLADLGAFGIKIPREYGGLGLSQTYYARAAILLGSYCGNLTALISAHQSIGVPQPLLVFGTEEQKRKYLPRVAGGEISAFALTELRVGSDPAKMETHAEPAEDGKTFILNGEKLWCTNGTKAGVIVVMARTPPKIVRGKEKKQVTAFIVETSWPGVTVERRCYFMGLKSLYNGVMRFENVRVPAENILSGEGHGLRVALTTLNTGRLTLPAACAGLGKRCLKVSREWARDREQWGAPIGHHAAIADKIARMAADTFAMEAMSLLASGLVDRKSADIRLEAALAKMWCTEKAWEIVNETMQIRGGRGYETAASLAARGEEAVPVERWMRDCRINTIFEGSSEIMRLFIAREALDPHLRMGGVILHSGRAAGERARAAVRAAAFYARWYPGLLVRSLPGLGGLHRELAPHVKYAERTARRLARKLFHAMVRFGPKLEREQVVLGHFVDIGAELFAVSAVCSRAQQLIDEGKEPSSVLPVAGYFCSTARLRVRRHFHALRYRNDREGYRLARKVLEEEFAWLEEGIL